MKLIIVGPPFVGKSTLVSYLRQNQPKLTIKELDELLIEANGGVWPKEEVSRNQVLLPRVIELILAQDLIFFTSYISPSHIHKAHQNGYKIIQLYLSVNDLKKRNVKKDQSREAEMLKNIKYQNEIWDQHLIDNRIIANIPTSELANKIQNYINNL